VDYDVIVIGSGITGLTASRELARNGLRVANVEANLFGGLVLNINELEGEFEGSGADLASTLMLEATDLGCVSLAESVATVARENGHVAVRTDAGIHRAHAAIVASGATLRPLGVPGERELEHKGVSHCADCDGPMYQEQDVVVVGGGDSALQEATVLSRYCRTVHVVHRDAGFTAHPRWIDALRRCANVTVTPRAQLEAIEGDDAVAAVRVRASDGAVSTLRCTGVFAYVGLEPASACVPAALRDAQGAVVTDAALQTSLPGVFAGGAVRAGFGGTLADAVRDARTAAGAVLQRLRD
jgi:thioredoxin reductase (NADPH)